MEDSGRVSGNIGSILSTRVLNSFDARCLYYREKIDCREKVVVSLDKRLYTMEHEEQPSATPLNTTVNPKKRTYVDAFGQREYDMERYGQEIRDDFFERNMGHGAYQQK